jgi:dienelactone hydrolase
MIFPALMAAMSGKKGERPAAAVDGWNRIFQWFGKYLR